MMFWPALNATENAKDSGSPAARWLRLALSGLALLSTFGFTSAASAFSYTLIAPITIDASNNGGSGVFGTINLVVDHFTHSAPTGANAVGNVNPGMDTDKTLQDFVWFSISLDAGSAAIEQIQVGISPTDFFPKLIGGIPFPVGVGFTSCPGCIDPTGSTTGPAAGAPAINLVPVANTTLYNFGLGLTVNNLQGGDTSADLLWVDQAIGGGQGTIFDSGVSFMIQTANSPAFNVTGVVPEPSTALLLGLGLCGLSIVVRRRGRQMIPNCSRC